MAETNFILFKSAGQVLALNAAYARQVVPMEQLYALPGTQGAVLGLIPAAGRALPVLDLYRLAGVGTPQQEEQQTSLALICEIESESVALPADSVIGFVHDELPGSPDVLSQEMLLGGYHGGGHKGRVINPEALIAAAQTRILSA